MPEYTPAVEAMLTDSNAPTAPLDEFLDAYEQNDNIWWGIGCGHHMNLFDAVREDRNELLAALDDLLKKLSDRTERVNL